MIVVDAICQKCRLKQFDINDIWHHQKHIKSLIYSQNVKFAYLFSKLIKSSTKSNELSKKIK